MKQAQIAIIVGRTLLALALVALAGAWITQLTGAPLMGMSQAHLSGDATVLALLGIAGLLDGLIHYEAADQTRGYPVRPGVGSRR